MHRVTICRLFSVYGPSSRMDMAPMQKKIFVSNFQEVVFEWQIIDVFVSHNSHHFSNLKMK